MSKISGRKGEALATIFLRLKGYKILNRNYHSRFGEIDIIAQKRKTVVFVEVKSRGRNSIASPSEWVDIYKQKRLIKTAQTYIVYKKIDDVDTRFDVIEVLKDGVRLKINHIINAFEV